MYDEGIPEIRNNVISDAIKCFTARYQRKRINQAGVVMAAVKKKNIYKKGEWNKTSEIM